MRHIHGSSEGAVELVRHRHSGTLRAFKKYSVLEGESQHIRRRSPGEIRILKTLNEAFNHPNVISVAFAEQLPDLRFLLCT